MAKLGQRQSPECGTGTLAHEMRKFNYYRRQFFRILGDTQKALKDVAHMKIFPLESTISDAVRTSQENALRPPAIVILGTARARLVNFLLGEKLLPPQSNISSCTNGWRWLRLQHGNRRQVRLNLGSDIEILEPNLTIDSNGDQISPQTLKRNDNLDLSTVMDIELCNPFLKNGVQILVPPDLGDLALDNKSPYEYTHESIIKDYETFFSKRGSFLENVFPIILYALDEIEPLENANNLTKQSNTSHGKEPKKNIYTLPDFTMITSPKKSPQFNPNNSKWNDKSKSKFYIDINDKSSSDSDESTGIAFNIENNDKKDSIFSSDEKNMPNIENLPGLSEENLLDLRQIFELHPNAQVLFVLFSNDSQEEKSANESSEFSTESFISNSNKNYGQPSTSYEQIFHFDSITPSSTAFEPHSMFPISSISPNINSVSPFADTTIPKDMKFDNFDDTNESSFNCDKNISGLKENGSTHLDKQKAFLIRLVEQLELMSNPLMKSSFTGHWLIVDDANINSKHICEKSPNSNKTTKKQIVDNDVILNREDFIYNFVTFTRGCLQNYMLHDCNKLSEIHNTLLQQFILTSFDMAREMQIIPRKIQYVSEMEQQLFDTLNEKFTGGEKREELLEMMNYVLQDMKNNISNINLAGKDSPCHGSSECINLTMPNSIFYPEVLIENPINVEETHVHNKNDKSDSKSNPTNDLKNNIKSISLDLNEYCIIKTPPKENIATKGVDALEDNSLHIDDNNLPTVKDKPDSETSSTNDNENVVEFRKKNLTDPSCRANLSRNSSSSFKQASLEVQRTVLAKLSRNISIQLVKFVDCLRDSYFGTLQRCLDSLEEGRGRRIASEAVRQILLVTRTVDLQHCASFSFLHALVDQLRRFFSRLSLSSGNDRSCCIQSPRWRRQVALDTIESLSATRLAKIISTQLRDRIRLSHEQFQSALQSLGEHHSTRLQETEELKLALRKLHAPRFARLCLESTSLGDLARYGVPRLGREIGRGQYGVVYSVKGFWGGYEPCAVKSVVPPDERHFNELAMEFFHTRNIPEHDRIVRLRGSVIDYSYEGCSPAVLLVSERLRWDLHCALLHANLSFVQRMQIAVDIVEGIRYLHSQGLVHRDIKLKNVLLDESNRAKLTDLGFCIPEAMMSGSIVGTPVHMAPELLSGIYDNSVDVYAFGILFWYVCAGHVKLPTVFEHFQNKEQLWCNVKKGLRPERLPQFSDVCWSLMEKCWAAEPLQRPLLGDVQPILEKTRDKPNFDTNIP